jgi:hypothetical protein
MPAWIAVASANHVAIGRQGGSMQVNHGKAAPLRRIVPGDIVTYYSPTEVYGTKTPLKAFTAIGRVRDGLVYMGQTPGDFTPWRRDVDWWDAAIAPIAPLLVHLELTAGKVNWGYPFRFGLLPITEADIRIIAAAMGTAHLI